MKVALCIPTRKAPFPQTQEALDRALPHLRAAGHEIGATTEIGSAYISWAASSMLSRAVAWGAEAMVLIEDDMSFTPESLLKLIETPGNVVSGNYRYKCEVEEYMGIPMVIKGKIPVRRDGCVQAHSVPAGFLKLTPKCISEFRKCYPELICDNTTKQTQFVDLFNHGAHNGIWYGQDFAFSRRWREAGGTIWMRPDLDISHWIKDDDGRYIEFPGNYQRWLEKKQGPFIPREERVM